MVQKVKPKPRVCHSIITGLPSPCVTRNVTDMGWTRRPLNLMCCLYDSTVKNKMGYVSIYREHLRILSLHTKEPPPIYTSVTLLLVLLGFPISNWNPPYVWTNEKLRRSVKCLLNFILDSVCHGTCVARMNRFSEVEAVEKLMLDE